MLEGNELFRNVTSVFLEAHRQNTANFSEANHSGGMLRFGELSPALVLQLLVPLAIFFLGFAAITGERLSGTLPMLLAQGVTWRELIAGKTLGVAAMALCVTAPGALLLQLWRMIVTEHVLCSAEHKGCAVTRWRACTLPPRLLRFWQSTASRRSALCAGCSFQTTRASCRLATLAQAISSTKPTAPSRIHNSF
jgi:hypothetical protein